MSMCPHGLRAAARGRDVVVTSMALLALTLPLSGCMRDQRQVAHAPEPAAATLDDPVRAAQMAHVALNLLLLPLLGPDDPPRWADPLPDLCNGTLQLRVNGAPLQPGAALPAGAFKLDWQGSGCSAALDGDLAVSGKASLWVCHEDDGLSAVIEPKALQVDGAGGTAVLRQRFAAALPQLPRLEP